MLTTLAQVAHGNAVLRPVGVLDARTYRQARDAVVKAALDRSTAVIVDVDGLDVPDDSSWAAFTSARWHVQDWPHVVIALASGDAAVRQRLEDLSISDHVPVFRSVAAAAEAIGDGGCRYWRRVHSIIAPGSDCIKSSRNFVNEHLMRWSMNAKVSAALTVTTIFVENALLYTDDGFDLRLEATHDEVVVAVSDASSKPAIRRERSPGSVPAGLDIVAALCHRWGNTPTALGKTVWARIGPGDTLTEITKLLNES